MLYIDVLNCKASPLSLLQCIDKILEYLASTKHIGIVYQRHPSSPLLSGYCDASFAGEDESVSRTGYFYLFRGNLVSWVSENPTRVMTSSTEAECRSLVSFSKENIWERDFHRELGIIDVVSPTIVYEDNSAAIHLSVKPGICHKRSKHFGIEWSYFKQCQELKEVEPVFVSTDEQPADILTKGLSSSKFIKFREMIMGDEICQRHFGKSK
jgi:hypothetical protein